MQKTIGFIIFSVLLSLNAFGAENTYYVAPATGEGADEGTRQTIQLLITQSLSKHGNVSSSSDAQKANFTLNSQILKLGQSYILKIDKMKKGSLIFSEKMKSSTLDDMDTVVDRLVKAVIFERSTSETADTQSITQGEETKGNRRYQATRQWRFSFGPAKANGMNVDGGASTWGIGYVWGLDPYYDLRLLLMGTSMRNEDEDDAGFGVVGIGVNKFFDLNKNSPYVMAEISHVNAKASEGNTSFFSSSDDKAEGWALGAGAGYKFFRTSNVNVGLEASYRYLFDKTSISDKNPSLFGLEIVIYY